jgi:HAD superfamily hydrolase (TIGR01509 family)
MRSLAQADRSRGRAADPKAVFLDFGGTLARSLADPTPFFRAAAHRAGARIRWAPFLRANEEAWDALWPQARRLVGRCPSFADQVHAAALHRIGFPGDVPGLVSLIREEAISPEWHRPYPEATRVLDRLREEGLSVNLVSNNVDYLPLLLANLGWSDRFDSVTYSQEAGASKPDPRIFRVALQRAGCPPSRAVFVGDSWEADYLGARSAGLRAIWLNRAGRKAPRDCEQLRTLAPLPDLLRNGQREGSRAAAR